MLKASPRYLQQLANMPDDIRRAWRYGDWDALGGNYFKEFSEDTHTLKPFKIPDHWPRYRSFDYGLDMFACFWWAVDEDGRSWCYREFEHSDMIVQAAAAATIQQTLPGEDIQITYAPPDVWNRQKDTGKAMAQIFMENGLPIVKADNNRVQGHMVMKDMMAPIPLNDPYVKSLYPEGKAPKRLPALMFFNNIGRALGDIRDIQADENNPSDCAKQPHDVTHTVDACVPADTLILTPDGPVEIGDLTDEGTCYAWDGQKLVESRHSPAFMTRESAEVFEIELDTGEKIRTTAEHRVLTVDGWKRMDELDIGDEILNAFSPAAVILSLGDNL